jgi:hypothetical protein
VLGQAHADSIGSFTYVKQQASEAIPVHVTVYRLEVTQELDVWPECNQRRRAWFSPTAAAALVQEPELRDLLCRVDPSEIP